MTDPRDRPEPVLVVEIATRLGREFDGTFDAVSVERCVRDSHRLLVEQATVTAWLPLLVERVARDRLRALDRLDSGSHRPAVLFLCVHNAGRSQIAAGWLRHLAGGRVDVFSGGTEPGAETDPAAVAVMREVGIDISRELPQPWTDEVARAADVIVSMGCGDACPVLPGTRFEEWDLVSPAERSVAAVRELRDDIRTRVEALVAGLGLEPISSGAAS
jgi:arsenate reductase (thioredoxin)